MKSDSSFISAYVSIQGMKSESRSSTCLEINFVLGFCFENVSKQCFSFVIKTLERISFENSELLCKLSSFCIKTCIQMHKVNSDEFIGMYTVRA